MKKGAVLIIGLSFLFLSVKIYAQTPEATGDPVVYKVTMQKFRISSDGGTTWTMVKEEDVEFDIANVSAGAAVGNFFAGAISPGTYNRVEHTVSQTFTMQGYVYDSGSNATYYTNPNGTNGTSSVSGNVSDTSKMPGYGEAAITVPDESGNAHHTYY